jgi:hypothetical protein
MSVTKIEACKRALSLTAERVLGLPLDFHRQNDRQPFYRVSLITPTGIKVDVGYLSISEEGRVEPHTLPTGLGLVIEALPSQNLPEHLQQVVP